MADYPDRRFVRLHLGAEVQHPHKVTYIAADPADPPTAANNSILANVAAADPRRAQRVQQGLATLLARENELFGWLEQHPDNTILFTKDPKAAMLRALPDLPRTFFDGWGPAK